MGAIRWLGPDRAELAVLNMGRLRISQKHGERSPLRLSCLPFDFGFVILCNKFSRELDHFYTSKTAKRTGQFDLKNAVPKCHYGIVLLGTSYVLEMPRVSACSLRILDIR